MCLKLLKIRISMLYLGYKFATNLKPNPMALTKNQIKQLHQLNHKYDLISKILNGLEIENDPFIAGLNNQVKDVTKLNREQTFERNIKRLQTFEQKPKSRKSGK